jgi:aspartyl-tRNA(Asn)/glutamyl-tRNA(Gln) amidotransferase subunit C
MNIDNQLVCRLAELSKLEFDEAATEGIKKDLQKILDLVQKLEEVNVDGIEPLIYMTDEKNVLRKDEIRDTVTKEEALQNAPQRDSDYFKVPKVIKK